jgi:hypothetical protein
MKSVASSLHPASTGGALRPNRHETWSGMRWTREYRRDEAVRARTAKSCGSGAPTLALSLQHGDVGPSGPDTPSRRRWQESPVTGKSTKETGKTIAQGMPECFGEPVVTNSCAFHFRTRGYGCIERPAFPAPSLFSREDHLQKLGREARRECGSVSGKRVSSPLPSALFRTGRRDPYFVISAILCSGGMLTGGTCSNSQSRWLWVPAFVGMT